MNDGPFGQYDRLAAQHLDVVDAKEIVDAWAQLVRLGIGDIRAEGIPEDQIVIHKVADLRYFGQGHEVQVDIPAELSDKEAIAYMWKNLHRVHDQTFGFHYEGEQDVELVNLRVQAVGMQHRPSLKQDVAARDSTKPFANRRVYWRKSGWVDCPLYRRTELAVRQEIPGPAIVEEYGSTVVLPASWQLRTDSYGNLILEKSA